MVSYKDRLAEALKSASVSPRQLADHLELTIQAINKVLNGSSTALTAANNSRAARFLRVNPDWLATDEGEMHEGFVWPFALLKPEQIMTLTPEALQAIETLAFSLLEMQKNTGSLPVVHMDTGVAPRSKGFLGRQEKPEFMKDKSGQRSADPRPPRKTRDG